MFPFCKNCITEDKYILREFCILEKSVELQVCLVDVPAGPPTTPISCISGIAHKFIRAEANEALSAGWIADGNANI